MFERKENKNLGCSAMRLCEEIFCYFWFVRLQSQSDKNNAGFRFTSINIVADKFQQQSDPSHYARRENSSYSLKNPILKLRHFRNNNVSEERNRREKVYNILNP